MERFKKFKSVSSRILILILLISSVMTTIFTAYSLYMDYKNEMGLIDLTIKQLEKSTLSSLTRSLWDINLEQVQIQVDSMMKINDVASVTVFGEDNEIIINSSKDFNSSFSRTVSHDLIYTSKDERRFLGKIKIVLTEENAFIRIRNKVIYIFLSQAFKTLLISLAIIVILQHFVLGDIKRISNFFTEYEMKSTSMQEAPSRLFTRSYHDEIDVLYTSISKMIQVVREYNKKVKEDLEKSNTELEKQRAYAESASRLASLGEMAGGIAHEINNPLMIISSSSDMIKKNLASSEVDRDKLVRFNDKIKNTLQRVVRVVQALKDIAREGGSDPVALELLEGIVVNVEALTHEKFKNNGVEMFLHIDDELLGRAVLCKKAQIQQVLLNLLNNSFKAVRNDESPWIKISLLKANEFAEFSIEDSGNGISESVAEGMFTPFFTTLPHGEGSGLGLSVARTIINSHGSELYYDDQSSNTRFYFRLKIS